MNLLLGCSSRWAGAFCEMNNMRKWTKPIISCKMVRFLGVGTGTKQFFFENESFNRTGFSFLVDFFVEKISSKTKKPNKILTKQILYFYFVCGKSGG